MSKWFGVAMGVIFILLFGLVAVGPAMADGISTTQVPSQLRRWNSRLTAQLTRVSWAMAQQYLQSSGRFSELYSANHFKRHRRPTTRLGAGDSKQ